jgi:hypothetical protein
MSKLVREKGVNREQALKIGEYVVCWSVTKLQPPGYTQIADGYKLIV